MQSGLLHIPPVPAWNGSRPALRRGGHSVLAVYEKMFPVLMGLGCLASTITEKTEVLTLTQGPGGFWSDLIGLSRVAQFAEWSLPIPSPHRPAPSSGLGLSKGALVLPSQEISSRSSPEPGLKWTQIRSSGKKSYSVLYSKDTGHGWCFFPLTDLNRST